MESTEQKLQETFKQTSIGIGVAIGCKLGLFKAILDIRQEKWTAAELARKSKCRERYVLEWLGLIVSAGLVKTDPEANVYYLTEDQKRGIKSSESVWFNLLPIYFQTFSHVSDCMMSGGPKGLQIYEQRGMASALDSLRDALLDDESFEKSLLNACPGLQDKLERGVIVGDIGCAAGRLVVHLAKRFPDSQFYGLDYDEYVINIAKQCVLESNLNNAHFAVQDINSLAEMYENKFDIVCALELIHNLPFPDSALQQVRGSLKDGGTFCMIQRDMPSGQRNGITQKLSSPLYLLSLFYSVSNVMAFEGGTALGCCVSNDVLLHYAQRAGFSGVEQVPLSKGFAMTICRN